MNLHTYIYNNIYVDAVSIIAAVFIMYKSIYTVSLK